MSRKIQLKFYCNRVHNEKDKKCRMIIQALSAENMPKEIFKLKKVPKFPENPAANEYINKFISVCSVDDLHKLPIDAPLPGESFFRKSEVEIFTDNFELANDTWSIIKKEVDKLRIELNYMDKLVEIETFTSSN